MEKTKKIAMLFPYAPSYREPIYQLMDKELDVDWFFAGNATRNLKMFNYKLLKNCNLNMSEKKVLGPISYYKGWKNLHLEKYDFVVIPGVIRCLSEWRIISKLGRQKRGPKLFLWTHGWYGKETGLQKIIKKKFFSKVDGFFLYGDYAKNLMIQEGFEESRLHVIKNSLDYDGQLELRNKIATSDIYTSHFGNNHPVIVFIGRLTPVKQLNQLIDAVAMLKQKGEEYNIALIGDGEMKEQLTLDAKKQGLEQNVWFYGSCFDEKTNAELIYNADVCVAPGNIGLTAMHSLMFGCPAISHNDFKWQMPEYESIHAGVTGDFFERNNTASLADCISKWFKEHKNKREEVRQACFNEIDTCWNPHYQLNLIKKVFQID